MAFGRYAVLFASLACAACGLVYELALLSLGSYLVGSTVHQTSIVLALFVFSMGIGAIAAKRLVRWPVAAFAAVEGALALVGGLSVLVLYAAFAWLDLYQPTLLAMSLLIGSLVGAEIPVLVAMLQRLASRDTINDVADLFAADYLGALIGGLAFPFVLLPIFGLLRGAIVAGGVNVVCAVVVLLLARTTLPKKALAGTSLALVAVVAVLLGAARISGPFELSARQALYDDPIIHSERSAYQDIVVTKSLGRDDVRLFLNGDLQFASIDEYRYHEALVHPAMAGAHQRVLILGGGDGLALREVLRYDSVREVTLVEVDKKVVRLAQQQPSLRRLNGDSLADGRVEVVYADAFNWIRSNGEVFDVVIVDFPDPEDVSTAKLYSQEMFGLIDRHLAPGGRMVVQAGSPHFARQAFWCIASTIGAAGWSTTPYHVDVPTFGDWGFVLAQRSTDTSLLTLAVDAPPLRSLSTGTLDAASNFSPDRGPMDVKVSTLLDPVVLDYERAGWRDY